MKLDGIAEPSNNNAPVVLSFVTAIVVGVGAAGPITEFTNSVGRFAKLAVGRLPTYELFHQEPSNSDQAQWSSHPLPLYQP